jgi:hypothetical protein
MGNLKTIDLNEDRYCVGIVIDGSEHRIDALEYMAALRRLSDFAEDGKVAEREAFRAMVSAVREIARPPLPPSVSDDRAYAIAARLNGFLADVGKDQGA